MEVLVLRPRVLVLVLTKKSYLHHCHLERNHLIKDSQYGFRSGRTCPTNFLEFLDKVTCSADAGDNTDVVYLDFAKAFDKVLHCRLVKKLEAHGIRGNILTCITNWLNGRKQQVCLHGVYCCWQMVWSGVPQRSVLTWTVTLPVRFWNSQMTPNWSASLIMMTTIFYVSMIWLYAKIGLTVGKWNSISTNAKLRMLVELTPIPFIIRIILYWELPVKKKILASCFWWFHGIQTLCTAYAYSKANRILDMIKRTFTRSSADPDNLSIRAYRHASVIDLYLHTKCHWDRKKIFFESHHWGFGQVQSHVTQKLGQI